MENIVESFDGAVEQFNSINTCMPNDRLMSVGYVIVYDAEYGRPMIMEPLNYLHVLDVETGDNITGMALMGNPNPGVRNNHLPAMMRVRIHPDVYNMFMLVQKGKETE